MHSGGNPSEQQALSLQHPWVAWCTHQVCGTWHSLCPCPRPVLHTQVYIDQKQVESGSLYDDFDMLPPKKIKVHAMHGQGQGGSS